MKISNTTFYIIIAAEICLILGYMLTFGSRCRYIKIKAPEDVVTFQRFKSGLSSKEYLINNRSSGKLLSKLLSETREGRIKLFKAGTNFGRLFDRKGKSYWVYVLDSSDKAIVSQIGQEYPPDCVYELDSETLREILEIDKLEIMGREADLPSIDK